MEPAPVCRSAGDGHRRQTGSISMPSDEDEVEEACSRAHTAGTDDGNALVGSNSPFEKRWVNWGAGWIQLERADPNGVELEFARHLGMDPAEDCDLLWIAQEALHAPLPSEWTQHSDGDDNQYFVNSRTNETTWENPLDDLYRKLYAQRKLGAREPGKADTPRTSPPSALIAAHQHGWPSYRWAAAAVAEAARAERLKALDRVDARDATQVATQARPQVVQREPEPQVQTEPEPEPEPESTFSIADYAERSR